MDDRDWVTGGCTTLFNRNSICPYMVLGLKDGEVCLHPYTPLWKGLFWLKRRQLQTTLGHRALNIYHVGSTAIPGMTAKPTLEIVVEVADMTLANACIPAIQYLGYQYQGENVEFCQHRFQKGEPLAYNLYLMAADSQHLQDKLYFRDVLRKHPALAREYVALKRRLARQYPRDRIAYQLGKAPFIQQVLRETR